MRRQNCPWFSSVKKIFTTLCVLFAQTLSSEEVLECSLCYERYDDNKRCPRLLSNCGHTFCTHCLEQLLKDGTISCPQDRKDIHVTAGVGGLPKNFALLDVLLASSHKQPDTTLFFVILVVMRGTRPHHAAWSVRRTCVNW